MPNKIRRRDTASPSRSIPNSENPSEPPSSNRGQITVSQQSVYLGPIPPPEVIRAFNEIVPNGADRIFKQYEQQAAHRQSLEMKKIDNDARLAMTGVYVAGLIALAGFALVAYFVFAGFPVQAAYFGAAVLAGLVVPFIYGTRSNRQERERRFEKNTKILLPEQSDEK